METSIETFHKNAILNIVVRKFENFWKTLHGVSQHHSHLQCVYVVGKTVNEIRID